MAKNILLRFGTRNLKRAGQLAQKVKQTALEATKEGGKARALVERLVGQNAGALRDAEQQRLRGLAPGQERADALRRANFLGQRENRAAQRQIAAFQAGAGRVLAGVGAARAVFEGNYLAGAGFLAAFAGGPVGLAVQAATMAAEIVKPLIEERNQELQRTIEASILGAVDRRLRDADPVERFKRDPSFRAQLLEREGAARAAREEAVRSNYYSQRWEREPGSLDGL